MNSVANKVAKRIKTQPRGSVFTPKDFLSLGTRATIDQTLSRLAKQGLIRRLARGIYDYPKHSKLIGTVSPDADKLAQALTVKSGITSPSGAYAANALGLSTQVPAKPVYLTNGPSRTRRIGGRTIAIKRSKVPLIDNVPDKINLMLQALSFIGKDNIDDKTIQLCANRLDDSDLNRLFADPILARIPSWIVDAFHKIKQTKDGYLRKTA